MRKHDIIECVYAGHNGYITEGRRYVVLGVDSEGDPKIKANNGAERYYKAHHFRVAETQPCPPSAPSGPGSVIADWSYAEATRLQQKAHAAIDEYNAYINAKPDTVFLTIFK